MHCSTHQTGDTIHSPVIEPVPPSQSQTMHARPYGPHPLQHSITSVPVALPLQCQCNKTTGTHSQVHTTRRKHSYTVTIAHYVHLLAGNNHCHILFGNTIPYHQKHSFPVGLPHCSRYTINPTVHASSHHLLQWHTQHYMGPALNHISCTAHCGYPIGLTPTS